MPTASTNALGALVHGVAHQSMVGAAKHGYDLHAAHFDRADVDLLVE